MKIWKYKIHAKNIIKSGADFEIYTWFIWHYTYYTIPDSKNMNDLALLDTVFMDQREFCTTISPKNYF